LLKPMQIFWQKCPTPSWHSWNKTCGRNELNTQET
jgi:hypothetical protein